MSDSSSVALLGGRGWFYVLGAVAVVALLGWYLFLRGGGSSTVGSGRGALNFVEVVTADLVQQETVAGTLGSVASDPIRTQLGGTITAIADSGDVLEQGETLFSIDGEPVVLLYGELPAFRDIAEPNADSLLNAVASAEAALEIAQLQLADLLDGADSVAKTSAAQSVINAQNFVANAEGNLEDAEQALADASLGPSEAALGAADHAVTQAETALQNAENIEDNRYASLTVAFRDYCALYNGTTDALPCNQNGVGEDIPLGDAEVDLLTESLAGQVGGPQLAAQISQAAQALIAENGQYKSTATSLETAQVALEDAKADRDALFDPPTEADIAELQGAIESAQRSLESAELGLSVAYQNQAELYDDPDQLALTQRQEAVRIAEIQLSQAQETLEGSKAGESLVGTDVLQLQEALIALGHDAGGTLVADGVFTPETAAAVLAFQAAVGLVEDGVLDRGEVVFLPSAVRVTSQLEAKGNIVGLGTLVLAVSLSEKVVRINLPANQQGLLAVGDAVIVVLPDFSEVSATVTSVAETATPFQGQAVFEVLVELKDPSLAADLDEAPVDVVATSESVEGVMAIPVSALVALLEGGYAVEVGDESGTRLVAVEVGFFGENGMIEVTSSGISPGDRVVVP